MTILLLQSGPGAGAMAAPVNTVLPVISGTAAVGSTLTTTDGTWTGSGITFTYQWQRGGTNIGGATANSYLLVTADASTTVTVVVTATNAGGSASATSAGLAIGAVFTTFDPGTISGVSLSNGNLTATVTSGTFNGARSVAYHTTGKYYFEVTCGTMASPGSGQNGIGIIASTETYSNALNNGTNTSFTIANTGNIFSNNSSFGGALGAWGAGDIISVAVDLTNRRFWARKNGGNWNNSGTANPATNTGGATIGSGSFGPFVGFNANQAAGHNMTANFGGSAFSSAAPSGFVGWS